MLMRNHSLPGRHITDCQMRLYMSFAIAAAEGRAQGGVQHVRIMRRDPARIGDHVCAPHDDGLSHSFAPLQFDTPVVAWTMGTYFTMAKEEEAVPSARGPTVRSLPAPAVS